MKKPLQIGSFLHLNAELCKTALFVSLFFIMAFQNQVVAQNLVTFNNISELTTLFNPDASPQFTNISSGGIGNTGAINVPLGSSDVWTTKAGYSVTGSGNVYTLSAYFKIKDNSGYGGLGFTTYSSGEPDQNGSPAIGLGMAFHGGGGMFINNRTITNVSWPPDLVLGNWYKMILRVTAKGSNVYDLYFQIWNSDANGTLGTMKTDQTLNGQTNTQVGGATAIHVYFSAAGSRMEKIDNFDIGLAGGAVIVPSSAPAVSTNSVSEITSNSATCGGNVTYDGGVVVTARGVCWSTSQNPTTSDSKTTDAGTTGAYTSSITGLTAGITYYVRAYATNSVGTSYGSQVSFASAGSVPIISVSPSSLDFGYLPAGSTSEEMTYSLSGSDLSPAIGNITITPPANFEISLSSGSGFSSSAIDVYYSSHTLSSRTVYVRFLPTESSTYSGNISNSGGEATTKNIAVSGTSILNYCAASTNNPNYMGINHIIFNTIDNNTGDNNQVYNDFTAISTDVVRGVPYTITINCWGYQQLCRAWFDWNNDGDFTDQGEVYNVGNGGNFSQSLEITIPVDATLGNVRMRVRSEYGTYAQACGAVQYGECEDYTVIVGEAIGFVWNASESSDWNTAANWSTNSVPTALNDVTIPNIVNEPVVNQEPWNPAVCHDLTIEPGAAVVVGPERALTVYGTLTNNSGAGGLAIHSGGSVIENSPGVEAAIFQDITSGPETWHLFISPVTEAIQASSYSYFNTAYLDRYDEPLGEWVRLQTNDYVIPETGYSINFPTGEHSLAFAGELIASPAEFTDLSYTSSAPGYLAGWNLIGNPYPCSLDPSLCSFTGGLNAFAYRWNGYNYSISSLGSYDFYSGVIPSLQGFFVRTYSGSNSLTLENSAKTHGAFSKNGNEISEMLKIRVTGNGYSDEAFVRFRESATSGFDQSYDAYKLFGIAAAPQLYSLLAEDIATVNTLPSIETNSDVALGFRAGAETTYILNVSGIESFEAATTLLLEDLKTNTTQDMRLNPIYSFSAVPGDAEHRFNLHFKNANGVAETVTNMVGIYGNRHVVCISNPVSLTGSIVVYDITGRQLVSTQLSGNPNDKIDMGTYTGNLLIKVITAKGIATGKVFVN